MTGAGMRATRQLPAERLRRRTPVNLAGDDAVDSGMTVSSLRVAAAAATVLFLAAACGGTSSGGSSASNPPPAATATAAATAPASSAPTAAAGAQITIASFSFGSPLTVKAGQKVSVKNSDGVTHTVTADDGKSFDASVDANGTASFTAPSKPGTYKFHCTIHPQMKGTLTVQG